MTDVLVEPYGGREVVDELLSQVQPLGAGQPEDVANTALFLASDESRLITGTSILVDGGYTAK